MKKKRHRKRATVGKQRCHPSHNGSQQKQANKEQKQVNKEQKQANKDVAGAAEKPQAKQPGQPKKNKFLEPNDIFYMNSNLYKAQEERKKQIIEDGNLKNHTLDALYFLHRDQSSLKDRQLRHQALPVLKCKICDARVCRKSWNHAFAHHGQDYRHTCPICLEKDSSDASLAAHLRVVHFGDVPLPCNICSKPFYSPRDLNTHILTHNSTKTSRCYICKFHFPTAEALAEHQKKDHKKAKIKTKEATGTGASAPCEHCGKFFHAASTPLLQKKLENHAFILHSGAEKRFQCNQCDKAFHTASYLSMHRIRLHTPDDIRPFVCHIDNCNKTFKTKHNLKGHQHYHRPPRFKCDKCMREFYWKPVLRSHKCPAA